MLKFLFGTRYNFTDTLYIASAVGAVYQDAYWVAAVIFAAGFVISVIGESYLDSREQ